MNGRVPVDKQARLDYRQETDVFPINRAADLRASASAGSDTSDLA
jgi:hypothetical protein